MQKNYFNLNLEIILLLASFYGAFSLVEVAMHEYKNDVISSPNIMMSYWAFMGLPILYCLIKQKENKTIWALFFVGGVVALVVKNIGLIPAYVNTMAQIPSIFASLFFLGLNFITILFIYRAYLGMK